MTLTRDERDRFAATTPKEIAYGEGACLETPPSVFRLLDERFKFDVDLTANETNHLKPYWFGPGSPFPDALAASWMDKLTMHVRVEDQAQGGIVGGYYDQVTPRSGFSNPPYGPFIPQILTKAIEEREKGFTSVFLLPNRAGGWFQDLVVPYYSELWYVGSRITFWYKGGPRIDPDTKVNRERRRWNEMHPTEPPKALKPDGALFDSIIVVYKPYDRGQWGLFPPPQRPNVWDPRTGKLRY